MKNGLVIWNVLLTILGGYLLFAQLNKKSKDTSVSSRPATGSSDSASGNAGRIAYFEMDSIEAHYDMVKDVQAEIQSKEKEYTNGLSQLNATYRKRIQQYQDFVTRRNLSLKKEIEDFIAKYNKSKTYSYIVVYEPGLFYYRDTSYNITPDVIKGLNEEYKSKKK